MIKGRHDMKDMEPSKEFTARVMNEVRSWEAGRRSAPSVRWLLPAGSVLLWLLTVGRLCFSLFAPALCH